MAQEFIFLTDHNIKEFYHIFSQSQAGSILNFNLCQKDFEKYIEFLNIKQNLSFLLKDDNKPIGLFLGAKRLNASYIPGIAVLKEHRRKGYGNILLQKGLDILSRYCSTVSLDVMNDNMPAINLYKEEGFKKTSVINNYRNENRSFFNKSNFSQDCDISINNDFTFDFLYKKFHNKKKTWHKGINTLTVKIKNKICDLYLIKKGDHIAGYIVLSRRANQLIIEDIGLNKDQHINFNYFITSLIKKEKIVQANGFYADDPLCLLFEKSGFFIDFIQYEMGKKLI